MPLTDPYQGWQTPAGNEMPDGAAAFAGLRDKAVNQVIMRFASTAARDAAITPAANRKAGMMAFITGLGAHTVVRADGGSWEPLQRCSFQRDGSSISGVDTVAADTPQINGLIIKTGHHTAFTSLAFGNEYMPSVLFDVAFPSGVLHLGVTQVEVASEATYVATKFGIDSLSTTGFRVLYPGGTTTTKRSYLWTAMGY